MGVDSPQVEALCAWLSDELVDSVTKTGYQEKIRQAGLPLENGQSIYHCLGQEWFAFQFLKSGGDHHAPPDAASAGAQLAKFTAGLYDAAALGRWMITNLPATPEVYRQTARITAETVTKRHGWRFIETDPADVLDVSFADTPFADGVLAIARGITQAKVTGDCQERIGVITKFCDVAEGLGGLAVRCYDLYAAKFLEPAEHQLPVSELAATDPA